MVISALVRLNTEHYTILNGLDMRMRHNVFAKLANICVSGSILWSEIVPASHDRKCVNLCPMMFLNKADFSQFFLKNKADFSQFFLLHKRHTATHKWIYGGDTGHAHA